MKMNVHLAVSATKFQLTTESELQLRICQKANTDKEI